MDERAEADAAARWLARHDRNPRPVETPPKHRQFKRWQNEKHG
jgi:hypothetical protein